MTDKDLTLYTEKARIFAHNHHTLKEFEGFTEDEVYAGAVVLVTATHVATDSYDNPDITVLIANLAIRLESVGIVGSQQRIGQVCDILTNMTHSDKNECEDKPNEQT